MSRDPRVLKAIKNLSEIQRVYLVISSKGGVGKTTISTLLALYEASMNRKTGLLDLDFVNPSTHIVLGLKPEELEYEEEKGVKPYTVKNNLFYFSIVSYTRDKPIALRGREAVNALWEILAIVNWGPLHSLFIDTPPGIGDEHVELLYTLKDKTKPIVVSTPSKLSLNSIEKLIQILKEAGFREIYLLENMGDGSLQNYAEENKLVYLGYIPKSSRLEESIGNTEKLLELDVATYIYNILSKLS